MINTSVMESNILANADIKVEEIGKIGKFIEELPETIFFLGMKILFALIVFFIGKQCIKGIRKLVKKSMDKHKADQGVAQFIDSFLKFTLTALLIFFIATGIGIQTASIVALIGSAGVAIGLAIQGSLSNFAGGVLILLLSPFKVGDYIKEDNHGNEGVVSEIQMFYTKLKTIDNKVIILPNGDLANSSMTNYTEQKQRMLIVPVGISYDADIKTAKNVIMDCMLREEAVIMDEDKKVVVSELSDHCVTLELRCWVSTGDYWNLKWSLQERIKEALDASGIEIPYHQIDVHMK